MHNPETQTSGGPHRRRRQVTTLAELVALLQDTCEDDRQVVRTLRQLMRQGHLRRLSGSLRRAA